MARHQHQQCISVNAQNPAMRRKHQLILPFMGARRQPNRRPLQLRRTTAACSNRLAGRRMSTDTAGHPHCVRVNTEIDKTLRIGLSLGGKHRNKEKVSREKAPSRAYPFAEPSDMRPLARIVGMSLSLQIASRFGQTSVSTITSRRGRTRRRKPSMAKGIS